MGDKDDADYGLTPREWLDSDPVPLTPDIDFDDPVQRIAWIRANNEEKIQRELDLAARRGDGGGGGGGDGAGIKRRSATTVVGVRLLNTDHRALVRLARRQEVTPSDLVRRWVRSGLDAANDVDPPLLDPDEEQERRQAILTAADAIVDRIADEVRRLREIVASGG